MSEPTAGDPRVDDPPLEGATGACEGDCGGTMGTIGEAGLADEFGEVVEGDMFSIAAERDAYYDQLLRTRADFENFRKRMIKQQAEQHERANERLVGKLLDVLDVFDGARAHAEGFEQVGASLVTLLEKEGLERIDPVGREFDPNEADAVAHEPHGPGDVPGAQVVSAVLRPGYRWKGRVVRPAMVKVTG